MLLSNHIKYNKTRLYHYYRFHDIREIKFLCSTLHNQNVEHVQCTFDSISNRMGFPYLTVDAVGPYDKTTYIPLVCWP